MDNNLENCRAAALWRHFFAFCAIPHRSGHEEKLREYLCRIAEQGGLLWRRDAAGNLRIDRPGVDPDTAILLQSHMDMVVETASPACDPDNFAVTPVRCGEWLCADKSSLGADNGIGLAAALSLIMDERFRHLPLAVLGTVAEETGLYGATGVAPDMLTCRCLLNLDSEEEGIFFIGCAGGERIDTVFDMPRVSVPDDCVACRLTLSGMKGGHSGINIHEPRGNAVRALCDFLQLHPECRVGALDGGNADNAIPRECEAVIAVRPELLPELARAVRAFGARLGRSFDVGADFSFAMLPCDMPFFIWDEKATRDFLAMVGDVPFGMLQRDIADDAVALSSNFASLHDAGDVVTICNMQRGQSDAARAALTERIVDIYNAGGGRVARSSAYPGWLPDREGNLNKIASNLYREMFGVTPTQAVIHAGLECGIFAGKRSGMTMLSFGPTIESPHSPSERVNIASVDKFYEFLARLTEKIAAN